LTAFHSNGTALGSFISLMRPFSSLRFDLAVNGGGAVTLRFQRSPLLPATKMVQLPWNGIVAVGDVVMDSASGAPGDDSDLNPEEHEDPPLKVRLFR